MRLTENLPRQPAWLLVSRVLRDQAGGLARRLGQRLGWREMAQLSPEDFDAPDSAFAKRAIELVTQVSPHYLVTHGVRSYAFGAALGRAYGIRFDPEVLFLASVMHDLGLTSLAPGPESFELEGARCARRHLLDTGYDPERADLVHEAIALHSSVGVASKGAAEVRLCHFGTGVDVAGIRFNEIDPTGLPPLLQRWPRENFKCAFSDAMRVEAKTKPQSHFAGLVGLGFLGQIKGAPFTE